MHIMQSRRDFLTTLSAAGAAGVLGARASLADEGPPETTTLRLPRDPNICVAPVYIADDLLRAEGFTDIRYVPDLPSTRSHAAKSTSTSTPPHGSSLTWMPASRSRRWRACIPAATSCSRMSPSKPSAI